MLTASLIANVGLGGLLVLESIILRVYRREMKEVLETFASLASDWQKAYESECEAHLQTKADLAEDEEIVNRHLVETLPSLRVISDEFREHASRRDATMRTDE